MVWQKSVLNPIELPWKILERYVHHHDQNTKRGNIFWKNDVRHTGKGALKLFWAFKVA